MIGDKAMNIFFDCWLEGQLVRTEALGGVCLKVFGSALIRRKVGKEKKKKKNREKEREPFILTPPPHTLHFLLHLPPYHFTRALKITVSEVIFKGSLKSCVNASGVRSSKSGDISTAFPLSINTCRYNQTFWENISISSSQDKISGSNQYFFN